MNPDYCLLPFFCLVLFQSRFSKVQTITHLRSHGCTRTVPDSQERKDQEDWTFQGVIKYWRDVGLKSGVGTFLSPDVPYHQRVQDTTKVQGKRTGQPTNLSFRFSFRWNMDIFNRKTGQTFNTVGRHLTESLWRVQLLTSSNPNFSTDLS